MRTVRSLVAGLFVMLIGPTVWAAACDGFTDVDSGDATYCAAVKYLKDKGITLGCTGTTYCPDAYVTRLQMALFLQRIGHGGSNNVIGNWVDTIGGGDNNNTGGGASAVGGGQFNSALGLQSTISGGLDNVAGGELATISGGQLNHASGFAGTVMGGESNTANGSFSAVAGGDTNEALATNSFAAGHNAMAGEDNCAIFGLWSTLTPFGCNNWTNVFRIGADNGMSVDYGAQVANGNSNSYVYIGPKFVGKAIATGTGAYLSTGGTWTNSSDRAEKTDLDAVDSRVVLERVVLLPMDTWRYKAETGQRHLGPMAQDFYAAFGLGPDDKHIATIDEGGVALAAIQGLNAKLEAVIIRQAHDLAEIKAQLAAMGAAH